MSDVMDKQLEYRYLDQEKGEIRFLELLPVPNSGYDVEHDIRCILRHTSWDNQATKQVPGHDLSGLDVAPGLEHNDRVGWGTFAALSYEWGEGSTKRYIWVDDCRYPVTENLYQALSCLRVIWTDGKQYVRRLWVDAICINQVDEDERNRQVPRMRDIYSNARVVYCSLTPDAAIAKILQDAELRTQVLDTAVQLDQASQRNWSDAFADDNDSPVLQRKDVLQSHDWVHVAKLISNSYWTRAWIVQEIALSHERARILWNSASVPVSVLLGAADMVDRLIRNARIYSDSLGANFTNDQYAAVQTGHHRLYTIRLAERDLLRPVREKRLDISWFAACASSSGTPRYPHDRIYGLLSLAPPEVTYKVQIDYLNLSPVDVWASFNTAWVEHTQSLNALHPYYLWSPTRSSHLPYFARDIFSGPCIGVSTLEGPCHASHNLHAPPPTRHTPTSILAHGIKISTIQALSAVLPDELPPDPTTILTSQISARLLSQPLSNPILIPSILRETLTALIHAIRSAHEFPEFVTLLLSPRRLSLLAQDFYAAEEILMWYAGCEGATALAGRQFRYWLDRGDKDSLAVEEGSEVDLEGEGRVLRSERSNGGEVSVREVDEVPREVLVCEADAVDGVVGVDGVVRELGEVDEVGEEDVERKFVLGDSAVEALRKVETARSERQSRDWLDQGNVMSLAEEDLEVDSEEEVRGMIRGTVVEEVMEGELVVEDEVDGAELEPLEAEEADAEDVERRVVLGDSAVEALGKVATALRLRRLATLADGKMGLVPGNTRMDDIVVALSGLDALAVLRKDGHGWRWIGKGWFKGLMEGEGVVGREHEAEKFVLI